jgi:hypothetical protein
VNSEVDAAFLTAEPISRKRMDLLWLDPPHLAHVGQLLAQQQVITITMGAGSAVQDHEITREDFEWAKRIERIVDKAYSAGQDGRFPDGIRLYKEALRQAPGCDLFLMSIGVGRAQIGEKARGIRFLERAVQISPGNMRIRKNLEHVQQT